MFFEEKHNKASKTKHFSYELLVHQIVQKGCRGCDRMVVGFTTTYAISAKKTSQYYASGIKDLVHTTCNLRVFFVNSEIGGLG
jgi:hypothetical protein